MFWSDTIYVLPSVYHITYHICRHSLHRCVEAVTKNYSVAFTRAWNVFHCKKVLDHIFYCRPIHWHKAKQGCKHFYSNVLFSFMEVDTSMLDDIVSSFPLPQEPHAYEKAVFDLSHYAQWLQRQWGECPRKAWQFSTSKNCYKPWQFFIWGLCVSEIEKSYWNCCVQ